WLSGMGTFPGARRRLGLEHGDVRRAGRAGDGDDLVRHERRAGPEERRGGSRPGARRGDAVAHEAAESPHRVARGPDGGPDCRTHTHAPAALRRRLRRAWSAVAARGIGPQARGAADAHPADRVRRALLAVRAVTAARHTTAGSPLLSPVPPR